MTAAQPLRMFLPITKVDAVQRLVYGVATGETIDRSGEICDYASTKPYYETWSGDIAKATDGKSLGNVRAMHGTIAAGKVTALSFNDEAKQIEICAKVVDDAEWNKVQEGVYTGFSQGGGYVKRWKDDDGNQRYTAEPSEVSLVDLPCLKEATFQLVKAAGAAPETKHFKTVVDANPTNAEITAKAGELAKAAGKEAEWPSFIEPARVELVKAALPAPPEMPKAADNIGTADVVVTTPPAPGDGLEQVWKAKDGATFGKKADAVAHNDALAAKAAIEPSTKDVMDRLGDIAGKLGIEKAAAPASGDQQDGTKTPATGTDTATSGATAADNAKRTKRKRKTMAGADKAAKAEALVKDLYTASRFAELLASLRNVQQCAEWEALMEDDEDDDGVIAEKLEAWIAEGCLLLIAVVQDECDDMSDADDATMEMAAGKLKPGVAAMLGKVFAEIEPLKKASAALTKAGARNSAADQDKIQAMHDTSVELGATCADHADDETTKGAGGDLMKALRQSNAERDALQKTISEGIMPILVEISERVENIEKQPLPLPLQGGTRVVSKGGDAPDARSVVESLEKMRHDDPDGYTLLMLKLSHQQPQQMIAR